MTELEKYIRDNAGKFNDKAPAEGHEGRFMAKLMADSPVKPANDGVVKTSGRVWRIIGTIAAAATLAGVIFAGRAVIVPKDPSAIYLAYMTEVSKLYKDAPMEDSASWDDALAQLTEESVPLFVQLPEEMSRREKARVLKQYYGDLLDGAKQFVNK